MAIKTWKKDFSEQYLLQKDDVENLEELCNYRDNLTLHKIKLTLLHFITFKMVPNTKFIYCSIQYEKFYILMK